MEISEATLRNWIKHGYIRKEGNGYSLANLKSLKKRIGSGELARLNRRANKTKAGSRFIPTEYLEKKEGARQIEILIEFIGTHKIPLEAALFLLSLNLFIKAGEIRFENTKQLFEFKKEDFAREGTRAHLKEWFKTEIKEKNFSDSWIFLINAELPEAEDLPGLIYQSLIREGDKISRGSYYTPPGIVKKLLNFPLPASAQAKALDPCCGGGQFLLTFASLGIEPENIYGFDLDEKAVRMSRTNLLLAFRKIDFTPRIYHRNTLLPEKKKPGFAACFDLIATNPPWGARYPAHMLKEIQKNYPGIQSKESFSFFIRKSYGMLKNGGTMSFVLPESVTNVKTHGDIRRFILEKTEIQKIGILGRLFKKVFSGVITLALKKNPGKSNSVRIEKGNKVYSIEQQQFAHNPGALFDIHLTPKDRQIFKKLFSRPYGTLKNNALWALGIVTGDNKRFLKNTPEHRHEPIYRGANIGKYSLTGRPDYIHFNPDNFQQTARTELYRAPEKLIYKFISNYPTAAYDNTGSLTLNSANILIPKIPGCPVPAVCAFINSPLYRCYFRKKFNSIKILRGHLEELPFPLLEDRELKEFTRTALDVIEGSRTPEKLESMVFRIFGITEEEERYIRES